MDNFRRIFYTEDELLSNALELPTSNYSNLKIKRLYLPSNTWAFVFNAKIKSFYNSNNTDIILYLENSLWNTAYIHFAYSKNSLFSVQVCDGNNSYIYDPNTAGFTLSGDAVYNSYYYYFGTNSYSNITGGIGIPAVPFYYIWYEGGSMNSYGYGYTDNDNDWYVCIDFTNCYGTPSYDNDPTSLQYEGIQTAYIKFLTITRSGSQKVYYEPYTS